MPLRGRRWLLLVMLILVMLLMLVMLVTLLLLGGGLREGRVIAILWGVLHALHVVCPGGHALGYRQVRDEPKSRGEGTGGVAVVHSPVLAGTVGWYGVGDRP